MVKHKHSNIMNLCQLLTGLSFILLYEVLLPGMAGNMKIKTKTSSFMVVNWKKAKIILNRCVFT